MTTKTIIVTTFIIALFFNPSAFAGQNGDMRDVESGKGEVMVTAQSNGSNSSVKQKQATTKAPESSDDKDCND